MKEPEVIDAEFELVEHRLPRFRWGVFFWWALYTGSFVTAAYSEEDPQIRALWAFLAAISYPVISVFGRLFAGLPEKVSPEAADLLRERMTKRAYRFRRLSRGA